MEERLRHFGGCYSMAEEKELRHLLYISYAVQPFSTAELNSLLEEARAHNEGAGITGMLLYKKQRFMQLLEGQADEVKKLFKKIQADERHTNILQLLYVQTPTRSFSNWSMGFCHVADEEILDVGQAGDAPLKELDEERFIQEPIVAQRIILKFAQKDSPFFIH